MCITVYVLVRDVKQIVRHMLYVHVGNTAGVVIVMITTGYTFPGSLNTYLMNEEQQITKKAITLRIPVGL